MGFTNTRWVDELFDYETYLRLNPDLGATIGNEPRAFCHFVLSGMAQGRQISESIAFDPGFYGEYYRNLIRGSVGELYHHWLNTGYASGACPSAPAFMNRVGMGNFVLPDIFTLDRYLAMNPELGHLVSRWHAFEHFIEHGFFEGRSSGLPPSEEVQVLWQIGRSFRGRGRNNEAVAALQRATMLDGSLGWVFEEIGNAQLDQQRYHDAALTYQSALACGGVSAWCWINMIKALLRLGRSDEALATARKAQDTLAGWYLGQQVCAEALAARFGTLLGQARLASIDGRRAEAFELAEEAAEITVQEIAPAPVTVAREPGAPLRIVALVNDGLPQCFHYRVLQKAQQLQRIASIEFRYFPESDLAGFREALLFADAALFYRVAALPHNSAAISYARSLGLPTIYEIDDLIFAPEHYPPPLESYGGLVDGHEYSGLLTGVPLFRRAAALCDYAIASTPSLARHLEPLVAKRECFIHRNALGGSRIQIGSRKRRRRGGTDGVPDTVTIFYGSGTKAHNSDFEKLAAPALLDLMRTYPHVELVVVGFLTLPPGFDAVADQVRRFDVVKGAESYWRLLREADINLAVLEPGVMNDCKSEIKWLEAATLGVPSVVSDTATYREILEDGETAFIASDPDEWRDKLERLVQSPELRDGIASRARAVALDAYSLSRKASELSEWLEAKIRQHPASPHPIRAKPARKKILIVNVFFSPQTIGGATRVVRDNVDLLIDRYGDEFDVSVFTTYDGHPQPYRTDRYGYRGIGVTRVSTPSMEDMDWRVADPAVGEIFAAHLARHEPDVIHFHCIQRLTNSVVTAARDAGIPYLVTAHDGWWISDYQFLVDDQDRARLPRADDPGSALNGARPSELSMARLLALRESLDEAEEVLAVSRSFATIYQDAGIRHTRALPNGLSRIARVERRASKGGRVRLAHIGGMARHKGFHFVRRALETGRFDRLELTMIDHAMDHGSIRHETWGATPVTIAGKVPQERIGEFYAEHDVLLAPSTWPESYGLVVREALAAGLWAVVSSLGALSEPVAEDINGFVVDVASPNPLYRTLHMINADPARFLQSPPPLNRWTTPEEQVDGLVEVYRSLTTDSTLRQHG